MWWARPQRRRGPLTKQVLRPNKRPRVACGFWHAHTYYTHHPCISIPSASGARSGVRSRKRRGQGTWRQGRRGGRRPDSAGPGALRACRASEGVCDQTAALPARAGSGKHRSGKGRRKALAVEFSEPIPARPPRADAPTRVCMPAPDFRDNRDSTSVGAPGRTAESGESGGLI
jgi:hypothetical protein